MLFLLKVFFSLIVFFLIGAGIYYFVISGVIRESVNTYFSFFSDMVGIKTINTPSSWKRYRNAEFSLSFKAPPEWVENSDGNISQFKITVKPR